MGASGPSTGGGGGVGPAGRKTDGTYGTKKDAKKASRRNELRTFVKEGGVTGAIIKGLTKGEEVNKEFFKTKVQPAGTSIYDNYEDYIKARGRGEVDAYGREISKSDNGGNNQPAQPVIVKKNIGGTEVQTTEAKLAEEKEEAEEYDARKTKKKGRRQTILTSQTGAGGNLVLGKPSLLGA